MAREPCCAHPPHKSSCDSIENIRIKRRLNLIPLLLNRYVLGGLGILIVLSAVFFAGDRYGFNARKYAACKVETARRNAAIAAVNRSEEARHAAEEARRKQMAKEFMACPNIQSCPLTKETAACLELLSE